MKLTVLGSGGCTVIPKPCCNCRVCEQAREKGRPYARTGPALFVHDIGLLVDAPAEVARQLNNCRIPAVDHLMFTHLDPDHVEGIRVVEQITLDFRTWDAVPEKQIHLILPEYLRKRLGNIRSAYGSVIDYYEDQKYVRCKTFSKTIRIGPVRITAIPVDRGEQIAFIYVFENRNKKTVYAPCDIRPFPEHRKEVRGADLLLIQPGIFETGLKHGFIYPDNHISRTTLYTFEQTFGLAERIEAKKTVFVHLEEYWNRSHDDYIALEKKYNHVRFAYDGMELIV